MDTRAFEYLVALDARRSFSAAARDLGVSPQAVSSAVYNLERELGVPLVSATKGPVRLTEYGAALMAHARSIVDGLEAARRSVAAMRAHKDNVVCIGCAIGVLGYLGEDFLERFERATGASVVVRDELPDQECSSRLVKGEYDMALLTMPPADGCLSTEVVRDHHFLWVNVRDPLSRCPEAHLGDLDGRDVVTMSEDYHGTEEFLRACAQVGVRPRGRCGVARPSCGRRGTTPQAHVARARGSSTMAGAHA